MTTKRTAFDVAGEFRAATYQLVRAVDKELSPLIHRRMTASRAGKSTEALDMAIAALRPLSKLATELRHQSDCAYTTACCEAAGQ